MPSDFQHGFRKRHSTESELLMQKEQNLKSSENIEFILGAYVDLCKALDLINHNIP